MPSGSIPRDRLEAIFGPKHHPKKWPVGGQKQRFAAQNDRFAAFLPPLGKTALPALWVLCRGRTSGKALCRSPNPSPAHAYIILLHAKRLHPGQHQAGASRASDGDKRLRAGTGRAPPVAAAKHWRATMHRSGAIMQLARSFRCGKSNSPP